MEISSITTSHRKGNPEGIGIDLSVLLPFHSTGNKALATGRTQAIFFTVDITVNKTMRLKGRRTRRHFVDIYH